MKKLIITLPMLFMACMITTEPGPVVVNYTIELINGGMSMVYHVDDSGDLVAVECSGSDSVYQYEFEFESGDHIGAGAYPDANSVVTVIIAENGENVLTEYILANEATVWYWTVK